MPGETLAERLKWAREASGLASRRVSLISGLSHSLVGHIEHARFVSRPETLMCICQTLGIDLDWLQKGIGPTPDPKAIRKAAWAARTAWLERQQQPAPDAA